jgi:hypothetical protein
MMFDLGEQVEVDDGSSPKMKKIDDEVDRRELLRKFQESEE